MQLAETTKPTRVSRAGGAVVKSILPWTIPILIIIFWQIASSIGLIDASVLPGPWAVVKTTIQSAKTGVLERNMAISLYRAVSGFIIGGLIGFILALCTGLSKTLNLLLDSSVQMLRNIPHLALIPLVIIWFGVGEASKISLVAIGVLFPIYINTYHGLRSVDPKLIEMGRSYQLSKWELFRKILLPGALPTILVGVRYALGVMWTTLIVSETIAASSGVGYMSTNAQNFMDMPTILMCIVIYAILGKISDLMAKSLENSLLQWQHNGMED
ncbi:ABC transporter permease subunit [Lacticaseibacillus sharpeae]|uniref:ABC transporter permease n=1 Tax=Lacticaseibacillus sharpeae JCM 1186 = DSM 20505 TaxID=1291052 RepID=A0A0R1ZQS1_9LACO|nr:ABC transporter permease subunit [Lacticaseibacillus sharpeae]KRM54283.1 ABC transporter permease [Lacticaseibacillus sharpeae JCM 1186 = DSM 20505]